MGRGKHLQELSWAVSYRSLASLLNPGQQLALLTHHCLLPIHSGWLLASPTPAGGALGQAVV